MRGRGVRPEPAAWPCPLSTWLGTTESDPHALSKNVFPPRSGLSQSVVVNLGWAARFVSGEIKTGRR